MEQTKLPLLKVPLVSGLGLATIKEPKITVAKTCKHLFSYIKEVQLW